jgi:hypothetical protein
MIAESVYGKPYILKFFEDYEHIFNDNISQRLVDTTRRIFNFEPFKIHKLVSLKSSENGDPFCFFILLNTQEKTPVKEILMSGTTNSLWMLRADVFFEEIFKDALIMKYSFPRIPGSTIVEFFGQLSNFGDPEVTSSTRQEVEFRSSRKVIDSFIEYKKSITQT